MSSSSGPVAPRRARPVLEQRTYVTPQYHSRVWGRLIFVVFVLVFAVVLGGFGTLYWMIHRAEGSGGQRFTFQVTQGDTVTSIANRLAAKGLIGNSLIFRLDARFHGLASNLKPGAYTLRKNMSVDDMVNALAIYKQQLFKITIPEGKRMLEIAAILQRHGIDSKSFLQEAKHPDLKYLNATILNDKPANASLEGYLFPDTYKVPKQFTGKQFARDMVQNLDQNFTQAMRQQAHARKFSIYQVLTLASIVEREAVHEPERPTIAGVYVNRLRQGWFLNADPTIQYAVGTPKDWWPVLTLDQLHVASPYNSYTHYGLPPGPIANPGLLSIKAAVNPNSTRFMFFVAKGGTGWHAFAVTQAQQDANIQRYQPH
ncbi:MAG TPA: endolytic transglycosylase MltG [Chloroflexi bacterium]|nr:endolytic transglycosylase MltG [Chloroflexota bacterium]